MNSNVQSRHGSQEKDDGSKALFAKETAVQDKPAT